MSDIFDNKLLQTMREQTAATKEQLAKDAKERQNNRTVAGLALTIGVALVMVGLTTRGWLNVWEAVGAWFVLMAVFGLWETR